MEYLEKGGNHTIAKASLMKDRWVCVSSSVIFDAEGGRWEGLGMGDSDNRFSMTSVHWLRKK